MTDTSLFQEYVTSASFNLTLSRPQIQMLSHIDQMGETWGLISTAHALRRKGLVDWEKIENFGSIFKQHATHIKLTEAGKAVIPLLKLSGLYFVLPEYVTHPEKATPEEHIEPVIVIPRKGSPVERV